MTQNAAPIRYAVVGLGHIAQVAVLPAFKTAKNSKLVALVSGDAVKRRKLGRKYKAPGYTYDQFEQALAENEVDAVYIALPNHLHCEYTLRAAKAGVHVLCEKPMAVNARECERMIKATESAGVKLMIAYRLHFQAAHLEAAALAQSGKLGQLRFFSSDFSQTVEPGNIRLRKATGGGTLWDIGIYCLNAARYLFRAEPTEVFAVTSSRTDRRFAEVEEMSNVVLRFPGARTAVFTASFGAADTSTCRIVGTKGDLLIDPSYGYVGALRHRLTIEGKTRERTFPASDQFAAELVYFSSCVQSKRTPEPSGLEGLIDVRIIEALYRSARLRKAVRLDTVTRKRRPTTRQAIRLPAHGKPPLVHVSPPGG